MSAFEPGCYNGNEGDVLFLSQPLSEESLCPKTHLTIIVTERSRSLRRVVKRLDMRGGVVGVGGGGHGGWWRERNGSFAV